MLRGRVTAVGPEQVLHGVRVDAVGSDDTRAECEEDSGALNTQRVRETGKHQLLERRSTRQLVDKTHGVGLALGVRHVPPPIQDLWRRARAGCG